MRIPWLLALVALGGCVAEEDDPVDLSTDIQGVRGLDGVPPSGTVFSEMSLQTGRLHEVPYGYVNYDVLSITTGAYSGGYNVRVLATCYDASQAREDCDPALVVLRGTGGTVEKVYSDQNVDGGAVTAGVYAANLGAQTNPQNALLTIYQAPNTTKNYWVATYSAARGTSKVNINLESRQTNLAAAWSTWASWTPVFGEGSPGIRINRVVGGTMVNLGPVQTGDVLEARAHGNANESLQKMWVFNLARNKWAGAWNGGTHTFDGSWMGGTPSQWSTSYALVGFTALGQTGKEAEKYVDVTLSPATAKSWYYPAWPASCYAPAGNNRPACTDGGKLWIGGGNYTFWVFARTDFPVGRSPGLDGQTHPATFMGPHCQDDDSGQPTTMRGQGNDLAFKMELVVDGSIVRSRYVPRGAFGSAANVANPFDGFSLDYRIPDDGFAHEVKMNLEYLGPDITISGGVGWQRSLEAIEMKVATANMEYIDGQNDHEIKNLIRLLGGSADLPGAGFSNVAFQRRKAAWRWNADVISMNEILSGKTAVMGDYLNAMTPFGWSFASFRQIESAGGPWGTDRYGPVFLKSDVVRSGGMHFSTFAYGTEDGFLAESSPGEYYVQPYRAAAKLARGDGSADELPIAVFNIYMPSGGNGPNQTELAQRKEARKRLVTVIQGLQQDEPLAFSPWSWQTDPTRFTENTRMIILGDSNMMNHRCGEVNELLEELRSAFGYAIDVSMAAVGSDKRTFDMHYNALPLDYTGYGGWYAGIYDTAHQPFGFLDMYAWQAITNNAAKYAIGATQRFAWWADARSQEGGGDPRYDVIILAGRGWAFDDPVRDYMTVANLQYNPNEMNAFGGGAVDVRKWCSDGDRVPTSYGDAYTPDFGDVCPGYDGSAASGKAVYRSDHKPVGARLRVVPRPSGEL